ncbi:MAG TPA: site-2 protease family protein [Phenylobacterium sp.]|uniref:M50 family metallopeptidase n=1 Tax=Phenylobacterium sp. TaxID=1871053 RepID=UPI002B800284|nr:site-2 protease family protein [Phenylobacterium sp.]HSV02141.1 site-2 protease family protein [Phenylobacterium sp.]
MLGFLQAAPLYLLSFILVVGLLVTIHELGHFLVAKWLGTAIDRFSIGFGRPLASRRDRSGVEWRIGWLPLGGYVRFAGDENASSIPDEDELETLRRTITAREGPQALRRYFHFKPIWQRTLIVIAGPAANFLLAIVLFAGLLMAFGHEVIPARVGLVQPNSAAAAAGFRKGDLILAADGRAIEDFDALKQLVAFRAGVPMDFLVSRGDRRIRLVATPRSEIVDDPVAGPQHEGMLGIGAGASLSEIKHVRYGPIPAVGEATARTWRMVTTTVYYVGRMLSGQVPADGLRGPLGLASATGKVAALGAEGAPSLGAMLVGVSVNLIQMAAIISVSLGIGNLLPLPVLDGGALLFYAYEAVARRPLAAKVQAAGYRVGLALVLGLMLFATWNDLQRQHVLTFLGGFFS